MIFRQVEDVYKGIALQPRLFTPFVEYLLQIEGAADFWRSQFIDCQAAVFPSLPTATYIPESHSFKNYQMKDIFATNTDHTSSTYIRLAWALIIGHYTDSDEYVAHTT